MINWNLLIIAYSDIENRKILIINKKLNLLKNEKLYLIFTITNICRKYKKYEQRNDMPRPLSPP